MKKMKTILALLFVMLFVFSAFAFTPKHAEAAVCTHPRMMYVYTFLYTYLSNTQHAYAKIKTGHCETCDYVMAIGTVESGNEAHTKGQGISAVCRNNVHTLTHSCTRCGGRMVLTTPCPRPGNCPGLPF